ncbi:MAG TPA: TrmH family RNA methyltransferase [Flavobacteriales bacterium]|nr:TrmH family RNA methyltransferase [Flavobacteriales bacterium]HIK62395.1 TrmH family RNA methyltransferase [Flavobacteriales bacterium]
MRKLKNNELERINIEEFKRATKTPVTIILDNVRSAINVGSIFRTSDAFLIEKIILCGITAIPPDKEIRKTALGATDSVKWEFFENTINAVSKLKAEGYHIIGIEQTDKSTMLNDISLPKKSIAIIMGNEVNGVAQEVINMCNEAIEVPQFGTKHSLNISVATGIVIWELWKKLNA